LQREKSEKSRNPWEKKRVVARTRPCVSWEGAVGGPSGKKGGKGRGPKAKKKQKREKEAVLNRERTKKKNRDALPLAGGGLGKTRKNRGKPGSDQTAKSRDCEVGRRSNKKKPLKQRISAGGKKKEKMREAKKKNPTPWSQERAKWKSEAETTQRKSSKVLQKNAPLQKKTSRESRESFSSESEARVGRSARRITGRKKGGVPTPEKVGNH